MTGLAQDLRQAARGLANNPVFTAVAVLSLALGIGANTAVFSLINAFLLRPLPVEAPDRLVAVYFTSEGSRFPNRFSYPDLHDFRGLDRVFSHLVGYNNFAARLVIGEQPELAWGEIVTGNYFTGLNARPALGRLFHLEDDRSSPPLVVISYTYWRNRFHGDPSIIGRTLQVNGHNLTVTGVAPRGFTGTQLFAFLPDLWVPLGLQRQVFPGGGPDLENRGRRWLEVRGRLRDGAGLDEARAALSTMAARLAQTYPQTNRGLRSHVIPASTKVLPYLTEMGVIPLTTAVLGTLIGLVLLIACANVANLVLVRASARRREVAVRLALGAGRGRLIRQFLAESLLLSFLGAIAGLLLAMWLGSLMAGFVPTLDFPAVDLAQNMRLDWRVLLFTLAVSVAASVLFGLAPALAASRTQPAAVMKTDGGGVIGGGSRLAPRNLLVAAQVALAFVLLVGGGLFLRSLDHVLRMDPGFRTTGLALLSVDLGLQGYDAKKTREFHRLAVEKLAALPGVESASMAFPLPLDAYSSSTRLFPEGYVRRSESDTPEAFLTSAGPGYFETIGTPLRAGRGFTERDNETAPRVAVINETMARRFWPGQSAIGKRFRAGSERNPWTEVVGVARDGKYITLGEEPLPYVYFPMAQSGSGRVTLLMRTPGDPGAVLAGARLAIRKLDSTLPVYGLKSMEQFLERSTEAPATIAALSAGFGTLALVLAAAGIYGLMHYNVARRTREIGIRMAIGAGRPSVVGLVVWSGMRLAMIGLAIGAVAAAAVSGLLSGLLYGVHPRDPATFVLILGLLAAVALAASLIPARRASRVDPVTALRWE